MKSYWALILCLCQLVSSFDDFTTFQKPQEVLYQDRFIDDDLCDIQWKEIRTNNDKYFQIYDSWGKTPSGILKGHTTSLGHFQECLDTEVELKDVPNGGTFQGQYCLALIPLETIQSVSSSLAGPVRTARAGGEIFQKDQTKIKLGICVPAACSEAKVSEKLGVDLRKNSCSIKNQYKFEAIDYVAIVLFSTIGLLIVCSTLYDYYPHQSETKLTQALLAFSLRTNVKKLVSSPKKTSSSVDCLNGLRVFSMFWVIFGHIYMWNLGLPLMNFLDIPNWKETPFSMIIQSATVSVDTFLFISGFLIAWLGLKEMEKTKGKLNILSMYIHRYIRLTPAVAAAVLFVVSLLKFMGSGPYWHNFLDVHKKGCDEYWWSTLLYVQNYVNPTNLCLGHSWYLAVDTQLYILSPFILIGLWKWGKKFLPAMLILALLSIGCIFATFYTEGFNQVLGLAQGQRSKLIYVPTHTRYTSWLIGVAVGYVLYSNRFIKFRLPKWAVFLGWAVCLATMLAVIFGPIHTTVPGYKPSVTEAVFYETFSRISWCIAIGWIVFACQSGYGGPINSILSFSIWAPFCRLTYCMYIVHFVVQTTIFGNLKTDVTFSDFNAIQEFWSSFGLTLCVAIVFVLAFESPIIGLEKVFIRKEKSRSPTMSTTSSQRALEV